MTFFALMSELSAESLVQYGKECHKYIIINLNDVAVITSRFSVLNELYHSYVELEATSEDGSEEMLQANEKLIVKELTAHLGLKRDGSLRYQPAAITAVKHRLKQGGKPLHGYTI
jgi:hypothetical protein